MDQRDKQDWLWSAISEVTQQKRVHEKNDGNMARDWSVWDPYRATTVRSRKSYKLDAWLTDMKIEELRRKVVNENKGCDDADPSGKELQGRTWDWGDSKDINTNREQHSSRQSPRGFSALARP